MNESSGLKAHRTLAPANARYTRRQMMWGGQAKLAKRERFRTAKRTEIAARAGQKILFSGWVCIISGRALAIENPGPLKKSNNGDTIEA
jgi:hypothetical protein